MENKTKSLLMYKSESIRTTKVIAGMALFIGLNMLLSSLTISLSAELRISFAFLATAASCYFYGLWPNVLVAFLVDLLNYLMHPVGFYMPLFALTAILNAVIYSLAFYGRDKIGPGRVIAAKACSTVLCNILINPILLSMMYGTPFWVLVSGRLFKNAVLFPIECIMLYFVMKECIRLKKRVSWLNA